MQTYNPAEAAAILQRIGRMSCLFACQPSDPGADAPPCVPSVSC